jgi:hypothetical protein
MTREESRWKLAGQSEAKKEATELIVDLLKELREIDMKVYLPGYSEPALETFEPASLARNRLDAHLSSLAFDLGRDSAIDLQKTSQLTGDLDEAIRTLKSHLRTLGTWVKWIEGEIEENEKQKPIVKAIQNAIEAYNEWLKVKAVPKGKTKLGTKIQFQLMEVSRRDESWLVYYADTSKGKFRIIQQDNKTWRLDRQSVTWDAVDSVEYRKPVDAAKVLEAMLS